MKLIRWLPTLLPLAGAVLTAATPAIQQSLSAHPVTATILAALSVALAHICPHPLTQPDSQ